MNFIWSRPGFRESAFQPFKKEDGNDNEDDSDKNTDKPITEEEDSEVDEMVDIEKIEDKEEDTAGVSTPLVSFCLYLINCNFHAIAGPDKNIEQFSDYCNIASIYLTIM